ncbi:IMPACT family protein [Olsenella profusa]|uniref:YigZ family protein n=1 Tax=Olsenella profusa TaxID=138595 RepID=A0ABS2F331_9ACTN|nr:YigZ family protein [Olsenella profusa]MBM6774948.1 YigZ family protein [Olsenella profusa]
MTGATAPADRGAQGSYLTLRAGVEVAGEFEDRRSRFIAQLAHVGSEAEAEAFLAAVRACHHDARHNVPAWILADGRERCSDDGEPSRTSGMPVLEVLRGAGLADVCCVVTRYFGGTLLGPGGLVRAYTAAAQEAVAAAQWEGSVVEMTLVVPVTVQLPYALYERIRRMCLDAGGKVADALFAEDVQLSCVFRAGDEGPFLAAVRELAAGEELARAGEPRFAEF